MTDQVILDKIAALKAKVPENGATEAEAMASLATAAKLMEKHGVTEADLKNVEFSRDMSSGSFTQHQKAVHPSQKYCTTTIGLFCGVKAWTSYVERNKKNIRIFGMSEDVVMAEFLLGMIHDSMDRGWKEFLATNPKSDQSRHTQYWSFMIGFAERVNERIRELIEARTVHMDSTGNDLVEVKMALVEQGMESLLPDVKLRKSRNSGVRMNISAYGQGQAAGDKVNLQRPIQRQQSTVRRIA